MQKNNYIFQNIANIFENKFLQIFTIFCFIVFAFFFSNVSDNTTYFESIVFGFTYHNFIIVCFLPMVIFSNILLLELFDSNNFYIIRFKNKKEYLKELLKNIVVSNSFLFLILLIIIFTFLNLFTPGNFSIKYIESFDCLNIYYAIFIVVKCYILMMLFSFVFTFIFKLTNKNISLILAIFMSTSIYVFEFLGISVNNIFEMPIYFMQYFTEGVLYESFTLKIFSFIILICLYMPLLFLLYKLTVKKMRRVGV